MSEFEIVYTITDYYDGPRAGVANYLGRPHVYESTYSDLKEDRDDVYRLSPLSQRLFELALEDWQIWRRWETAFHSGLTTADTHPALPEDRARSEELVPMLKEGLAINGNDFIAAIGEFRRRDDPSWSGYGFPSLEVRWIPAIAANHG